jgi:hypothetical protein
MKFERIFYSSMGGLYFGVGLARLAVEDYWYAVIDLAFSALFVICTVRSSKRSSR